MIERTLGPCLGRNISSSYKDLVWTVATATDESLDLPGQTAQALAQLDENLARFNADKTGIISAQIFIANIEHKPIMDEVWNLWIGDDPTHWPQRSCLGVELGGNWLIEIIAVAIRQVSD